MWSSSGSTPSSSQVPEIFTLSLRERKLISATCMQLLVLLVMTQCSFISACGHDQKFMTIGGGSNIDWLIILRALPFCSPPSLWQQTNTTTGLLWLLHLSACHPHSWRWFQDAWTPQLEDALPWPGGGKPPFSSLGFGGANSHPSCEAAQLWTTPVWDESPCSEEPTRQHHLRKSRDEVHWLPV